MPTRTSPAKTDNPLPWTIYFAWAKSAALALLTPGARHVYTILVAFAGVEDCHTHPKTKTLARLTGLTKRAVFIALAELKNVGLIEPLHQRRHLRTDRPAARVYRLIRCRAQHPLYKLATPRRGEAYFTPKMKPTSPLRGEAYFTPYKSSSVSTKRIQKGIKKTVDENGSAVPSTAPLLRPIPSQDRTLEEKQAEFDFTRPGIDVECEQ